MADPQDLDQQRDLSLQYAQPATKEQKEAITPLVKEREAVREYKEPEPSKEVEPWIERVEKKEIKLPQSVYDDSGQVVLEDIAPQKPKITLPLDDTGIQRGLKYKVQDSIRWLAEWCLRIIKIERWRTA